MNPEPQRIRKPNEMKTKVAYLICALLFFAGTWAAPGLNNYASGAAVLAGAIFAWLLGNPLREHSTKLVHPLLGWAIVGMGFGMNLPAVLRAGAGGILYTLIGISLGLGLGIWLGKKFRLTRDSTLLISVGTSICGGSAIAAAAPVLKAKSHDIALATAIVFLLNAIALVIFPMLGHLMGFTQVQFGEWAALAIHDTSSVVGASMQYGETALEVGTTIKLARALWIVPVSIFLGYLVRNDQAPVEREKRKFKIRVPWFIPGFLLAALLVTALPVLRPAGAALQDLSKHLMLLTLFLIGSNLDFAKIRELGIRPVLHGVTLWVVLATIWGGAIFLHWLPSSTPAAKPEQPRQEAVAPQQPQEAVTAAPQAAEPSVR